MQSVNLHENALYFKVYGFPKEERQNNNFFFSKRFHRFLSLSYDARH